MKPGDQVTRKHPRPQNRRHGFVVSMKGKVATVKFTGSVAPVQVHIDHLQEKT